MGCTIVLLALAVVGSVSAEAGEIPGSPASAPATHKEAAGADMQDAALQANNPIANAVSLNLQNEFVGNLSGVDESANILNFRAVVPFRLFGGGWVSRATLPLVTLPTAPNLDRETGIGDFNTFALKLIDVGNPRITFGFGPNLTVPIGGSNLGGGTWNMGLANVMFNATNSKFQWGYLIVWETSVARSRDDAPDQNRLFFQPFGIYQLGDGWLLRSTGVWNFDFENKAHATPVGLGIGKIVPTPGAIINMFFEPQYSVFTKGPGQREWGLFFGVNFQLR
jgi:hypothetical protein